MEIICNPAGVLMDAGKRFFVKCSAVKCKQPVRRFVGTRNTDTQKPGSTKGLWTFAQVEPCMHTEGVEITEDTEYTTKWRGREPSRA